MTKLWISHPRMTGQVNVDEDCRIVFAPPVWQRFLGQRQLQLVLWLAETAKAEEIRVVVLGY